MKTEMTKKKPSDIATLNDFKVVCHKRVNKVLPSREEMTTHMNISEILRAKWHKRIADAFYYVPPFLDNLREELQARLVSRGGRRTIPEWTIVRKIRFSKANWDLLTAISKIWSTKGKTISPGQIASIILEKATIQFIEKGKK
jgi:hypothetical protein